MVAVALDGEGLSLEELRIDEGGAWRILSPPSHSLALQLPIRRVPTTILVNDLALVERVWTGELSPTETEGIEAAARRLLPASNTESRE